MAIWVATELDRMCRPPSTTAAAVSSQEVSMPRTRRGFVIDWISSSSDVLENQSLVHALAVADLHHAPGPFPPVVHQDQAPLGEDRPQSGQELPVAEAPRPAHFQGALQPADAGLLPFGRGSRQDVLLVHARGRQ